VWSTGAVTGITNWRTDAASNVDTQAVPDATSNVFFDTTAPAAGQLTNNLGTAFSIGSLTFTNAATANVTIGDSNSAANTLTIGAGGITLNNNTGTDAINANVVLGASQTWTNNSSGVNQLLVNGGTGTPSITGSNNLTVSGIGNTTIAAA